MIHFTYTGRLLRHSGKRLTHPDPAPVGILARWNLGAVGAESLPGWTNVFGNPATGTISGVSDGITLKNNEPWTPVNGSSAYNNTNTRGGIRYLDDNGEEQLLSQVLTRSNWVNGSASFRSFILEDVPLGNYYLRIWSFTDGGGSWSVNTATVTFIARGLTDVSAVDYKYFQNTDDRVKGVRLPVSPKVNNTILVNVDWGTGAWFGACVNAVELRQYF
jgi:hypothetical protein